MNKRYKAFSDGQQWTILSTDDNGVPMGSALGSFGSQTEADKRISEMLADNGVHMGVLSHKRSGFKLIQNNKLWVAWYSNAAQDLQGEYFPRKATDEFIGRVDRKQLPPPELWWFHMRGAKHGDALLLGRIGLITLGVGKFDDTPIANKFKSYYVDNQQSNSHGFLYDPARFKGGAYHYYNTFEISTLPPDQAANPYTSFEVFDMFDAAKIKSLEEIVGTADAELVISNTAEASKQIAAMGAKFKAMNMSDPAEPDEDDAPAGKKKAAAAPPAAEKAIDVRIGTIESTVVEGFKAITTQLGAVLTPLGAALADNKKSVDALNSRVEHLDTGLKAVVAFLKSEMEMQPPATVAPSTVVPSDDPGLQFMQMMQKQAQGQQQGQKGNNPLGLFGDVFGAIGLGGKAAQQSPFEVPGAFGSGTPAGQTLPQVQPQQPTTNNPNQFVASLLGQPQGNTPNQLPGVGIPRIGQ